MFDQHQALLVDTSLGQSTVETSLLVAALLATVVEMSAHVNRDSTVQRTVSLTTCMNFTHMLM
jgi:hypothetical protein